MNNIIKLLAFSLFTLISQLAIAQPRPGMQAAEIALPSANGDTIKLSSLKGKVVLIDFWASWCGPCRASNKVLNKIYPKYKNKGFEIFAISVDENYKQWTKAIAKDKMKWLQVNDNGGPHATTARNWSVYSIPTSYLIDKQGRLVAMDLGKEELIKAIEDLLSK